VTVAVHVTAGARASSPATARVVVDGAAVEMPAGGSVLDALRTLGIHVPALCHDERIEPVGACRACLVEVRGAARLAAACTTPLTDGMTIETDTPTLRAARRGILEMLVRRYPADALTRSPDKPFHREVLRAGLADRAAPAVATRRDRDRSHPYIAVDMARCIDCYRCVRICAEVQGQFVWHVRSRGLETRIVPDGPSLRDSSCVSCGACVDTCPTGALEDRTFSALEPPSQWTRTTCPYCGVGCELAVGARGASSRSRRCPTRP
jgi:formate dehydrogenase major subunit